jgi:hypothetical protein
VLALIKRLEMKLYRLAVKLSKRALGRTEVNIEWTLCLLKVGTA